jgi:8-oxo-dGTP diphosphatase
MKHVEGVAAILIHNKKIAAFCRNYGDYTGFYEFVGGKIEANETHAQALIRECQEEIECDIIIDSFFKTITFDYPDFQLQLHCYLCTPQSIDFKLKVHSDVQWVDKTNIETLPWLPADLSIMDDLKQLCYSL